MGPDWYFNRSRWDTGDGYAPYDRVLEAWKTLQMGQAFDRVSIVHAIGISKAGEQAGHLLDQEVHKALDG